MGTLVDDIRHEAQRGVILMILIRRNLDWVPVGELKAQLQRGQGYALTDDDLKFHLQYLADSGRDYVQTQPLRLGRAGETEPFLVRATARAVDLADGRIAADPGVAF